jgi:hypothetical protein
VAKEIEHATGAMPGWHRLVVLSPFFLDATEMTVAHARSLHVREALPSGSQKMDTGFRCARPDR